MIEQFTGEIKAWHACGCIDIELPSGKKVVLLCPNHKNTKTETQKKEFTLQKALLETLTKDTQKRLSQDEWI